MRSRIRRPGHRDQPASWLYLALRPWILLPLFLVILLSCFLPSSSATGTPTWAARPAPGADETVQDLKIGLRAQNALVEDQALAGLDLGVSVHHRVATLWGTVPTGKVARQAEARLRLVLGLAEIKNELHIENGEGLPPTDAPAGGPAGQQIVARRPADQHLGQGHEVMWRPAEKKPSILAADRDTSSSAALGEWRPRAASREDTAPALAKGPAEARVAPLLSVPAVGTTTARQSSTGKPAFRREPKTDTLAKSVERLQLQDARFKRIRPEVRGPVVYLRGDVFRWDHLYELARAIANLPGVERVVLQDVHADVEQ
jgi:osmotically-inducible protein OsmY